MTVYYANSLYHHGIKGQKWGVRRFQKKDGSLTPAGRKRYDDDGPSQKKQKEYKIPENKSLHRLKIEDKYQKQGMSKKQAEQAAAKRIRGEQFAVAAGAVTVAACVAYAKRKAYSTDKILSKDTEFQRIMKLHPDATIHDGRQYMAYKKEDKSIYKGQLAANFNKQIKEGKTNEKVYDVTVKAKQDIKIASEKRARETFEKLYKNDPEFRKSLSKAAKDAGDDLSAGLKRIQEQLSEGAELSDKRIKSKAYDLFNVALADNTDEGRARAQKFYDALKEQGMNAVQDMNDKKYSLYNAKAPIITFDGSYDYSKRVLESPEIVQNMTKPVGRLKRNIATGAALATWLGGIKIKKDRAVEKYRMEHPNTKLTNKEIRDLLEYGE